MGGVGARLFGKGIVVDLFLRLSVVEGDGAKEGAGREAEG